MDWQRHLRGMLIGGAAVIAFAAVLAVAIVYAGAYDVSATTAHTAFGRWALSTTMHRSVERQAAAVTAPEQLTPAMAREGATHYATSCAHCHGGAGVDREPWARGMLPRPPRLAEVAAEWQPREIYWIARHGIRMSGMPAFGDAHAADELWAIVAFVKELPAMTPERYAQLTQRKGDEHATARDTTAGSEAAACAPGGAE